MPTLNLKRRHLQRSTPSEKTKEVSDLYNTISWRKLRDAKYMSNPLCEKCLEQGIITPTEEIHHIIPISKGKTPLERRFLAFDPNNVMSLCKKCHHALHNSLNQHNSYESLL